jgi:hypothetical protein
MEPGCSQQNPMSKVSKEPLARLWGGERSATWKWWWFDLANENERCEQALRWELVRRTKAYPAVWSKWPKKSCVIEPNARKSKASEVFRFMHLLSNARDALGSDIIMLLCNGFDPALSWLELSQSQRLCALGIAVTRHS